MLRSPLTAFSSPSMLPAPLKEFVVVLDAHEVDFLIVGGYAVAVHGFPRYTGNLDIFVAVNPRNAEKLVAVFSAFGFGDMGLTPHDFLATDTVVEIGREPLKIQVLTGIDGVEWAACQQRRKMIAIDGFDCPFIGFEDLLANKAASPRAKDKIDLAELRRLQDAE